MWLRLPVIRTLTALVAFAAAWWGLDATAPAAQAGDDAGTTRPASIYRIPIQTMAADKGTTKSLAPYRGKVLLIVNVASKCGFTPQYAGLESLQGKYGERGLRVLGFPCNDFGNQEPGTEAEIVRFCRANYDVSFPLFAKMTVRGDDAAPLYKYLLGPSSPFPGPVKWNFEKFLIARNGRIAGRFVSQVTPDSPELTMAIERELARPVPAQRTPGPRVRRPAR